MSPHPTLDTALSHHRAGRLVEAEDLYRQILSHDPNHPDALHLTGVIALQQAKFDVAADLIRRAIDIRNDWADAWCNLGTAYKGRGDLNQAIAAYQKAIELGPDHAEMYSNLGMVLKDTGQLDGAVAAFRQAIALGLDSPETVCHLGEALGRLGQFDQAIAADRQAIAMRPDFPEAWNNLGNALGAVGELDEAIAALRKAIELGPENAAACSTLLIAIHFHPGYDARAIAEEHRRWQSRCAQSLQAQIRPHLNDRDPARRIRVGYVSSHFREGPLGRFILPLFAHHDHQSFEIHAYANLAAPDEMTARLRGLADRWRSIIDLSDQQAADVIRADGIDILIDLTLHMGSNRILIFARKPAPVQATYLAYCSTTGVEAMDYRLSDPWLDPVRGTAVPAVHPEGAQAGRLCHEEGLPDSQAPDESIYTEKTIRLPDTWWCYEPHLASPAVGHLPALEQGVITFGCLNDFTKVSEPAIQTWAAILRAVPGSRLLLHAPHGSCRKHVEQRFGIDSSRVRFSARVPIAEYFALYGSIDVALDPFPYAGGTTTCDALWMGVPVVSLVGKTAVGRGGLSILSNIGLPELAARSLDQYVQIAVDLARDLPRLEQLRLTLRQRMQASPLMDAPRFARNVENAYRLMWREWCRKK